MTDITTTIEALAGAPAGDTAPAAPAAPPAPSSNVREADLRRGYDSLVERGILTREAADAQMRADLGLEPGATLEQPVAHEVDAWLESEFGARPGKAAEFDVPVPADVPDSEAFQIREEVARHLETLKLSKPEGDRLVRVADAHSIAWQSMDETDRKLMHQRTQSQLVQRYGAEFEEKFDLACRLLDEAEKKTPGLLEKVRDGGLGASFEFMVRTIEHAERLAARHSKTPN
jgi:hypothetical protein